MKDIEVLRALASCSGAYGSEIAALSNGTVGRGEVYVILGRLEHQGWVRSEEEGPAEEDALPRTKYFITEGGRRAVGDAEAADQRLGAAPA